MSYTFYSSHPFLDLFGSFLDPADEPRTFGGRCEGGPCGPGDRFRAGHRGRHHHHGSPRGGWRGHHHGAPWQHGHHHRPEQSPERSDVPETYVPPTDVYSTETAYKIYMSIPSAEKESVELTYDPNTRELAVSGILTRPTEFAGLDEEALKNVLIQSERKIGKFERKMKIPQEEGESIRFEEAVAKFENGVLELTLPKVEKEGPKTIVID